MNLAANSKFNSSEQTIIFSLDLDWVDDATIDWTMGLFEKNGIPLTVFATHKTSILEKYSFDFEVGIHPNFLPIPLNEHNSAIRKMMSIFPEAKSVRSHGLCEYSNLFNHYKDNGLKYDSSQLLYLCANIQAYQHPSGIIRLPIYWEDDDYLSCSPNWSLFDLKLEQPGLKCFDFHPVHLRLNTYDQKQSTK